MFPRSIHWALLFFLLKKNLPIVPINLLFFKRSDPGRLFHILLDPKYQPMRKHIFYLASILALMTIFGSPAASQECQDDGNIVVDAAKGLGKTGVIVIGSAAKVTWTTTKFTAKRVAKPVAKTVFLKAAPRITIFALKRSGTAAKHLTPIAVKLALL